MADEKREPGTVSAQDLHRMLEELLVALRDVRFVEVDPDRVRSSEGRRSKPYDPPVEARGTLVDRVRQARRTLLVVSVGPLLLALAFIEVLYIRRQVDPTSLYWVNGLRPAVMPPWAVGVAVVVIVAGVAGAWLARRLLLLMEDDGWSAGSLMLCAFPLVLCAPGARVDRWLAERGARPGAPEGATVASPTTRWVDRLYRLLAGLVILDLVGAFALLGLAAAPVGGLYTRAYSHAPDQTVYFTGEVRESSAAQLARWLEKKGVLAPGVATYMRLSRDGDVYSVAVAWRTEDLQDDSLAVQWESYRSAMSAEVFGGAPVRLLMCDSRFWAYRVWGGN